MIGPVVSGWVFLLFAVFIFVIGVAVLALIWAFITSMYDLVHPGRDGGWGRPLAIGAFFAVAIAIGMSATAEDRATRSKVADVTSISTLSPETFSTKYTDNRVCRIAEADGPTWEGNETRLLETVRQDADAFEADGWNVTRYRASDMRRGQLAFDYEPWLAQATKGDIDVRIGIDRTFRYTVYLGECPWVDPPDATFSTEIEEFPAVPEPGTSDATAATDDTLRAVYAEVDYRSPGKIEQVVAHGIGSPLDCFVSSFETGRPWDRDFLETLEQRLSTKGWTILDGPNPLIAVNDDEAVVASINIDYGLRIRSYPHIVSTATVDDPPLGRVRTPSPDI